MTIAEFLDEADLDLAALQHGLDTAQRALDMAVTTQRAATRVRGFARRLVVVVAVSLIGAGVAYGLLAILRRRSAREPVAPDDGPGRSGSVAPVDDAVTTD